MITINGRVFENAYSSAQWATANPVLLNGVLGFDTTVKSFKMGDGVTHWLDLPFYCTTEILDPTIISKPSSTVLPIILNYDGLYGDYPTIQIRNAVGTDITALATIDYGLIQPLTTISVSVSDSGSGSTDQNIIIIIKA